MLFLQYFLIAKERISIEKGSRCIKKVRNKKKAAPAKNSKKRKEKRKKIRSACI